ncbi:hypothetical protein ACIBG7_43085 [Nonomuraea sp. NPDC050328]|uniref:hypothetical protein n=1 Tax=Nonomuraea sp. NPDC050328 TaxID=3364361 RepID=UPI0037BA1E09
MSGRLVGEVVEWLRTPAARQLGLSHAERAVLFVVAERAHEGSRDMLRHRTDDESLFERIRGALDIDAKSLGNVFGRLARRGLDVRVSTGTDKRGRPTFANNGHSMRFRLPEFPASVVLPTAQSSIDEWTFPVDNPTAEPVENPSGEQGKVHPSMELQGGRSIDGWSNRGERSIDGWTVSPSKDNPSKSSPSPPVVPVSQPDVEDRPAVHREPSAKDQVFRQPPLLTALPGTGSRSAPTPTVADYDAARAHLARLPDLGHELMARARAELGDNAPRDALAIRAHQLDLRAVPDAHRRTS